ncbi:FecR family protein [Bosea minatitlanensis]|uniref:FecR family protein n=1 Tax=Bosea minatitlanensis TaxID=128782 RepID=A0ABW0EYN0_9HYPH|nr:FecR domain-containing protein [Bosea minatitlanensis]MCT4495190.1 FecR domain-containing protein [Bosea minatitlanensis]
MDTDDSPRSDELLLEKQAIAWFTRMNGRPSHADRMDFEAWLAASGDHVRHYDKVAALWSEMGTLSAALGASETAALAAPLERIRALRRARGRGRAAAGTVLCLALVLCLGWIWLDRPHLLENWQADQVTARGEQRTIVLADGSTAQLDSDSALAVDFSDGLRRVRLLRGTAFFEVKPSGIPFVVGAGQGEARVLGTSFEVAASDDGSVAVTLASGSVTVELPQSREAVILRPGERVAYGGRGLGTAEAVDVADVTAWRSGRLIFNDMPLSQVLARIERHHRGRIVLLGSALGGRHVTGNVTLRDRTAALAALQSSVGFSITTLGSVIIVSP